MLNQTQRPEARSSLCERPSRRNRTLWPFGALSCLTIAVTTTLAAAQPTPPGGPSGPVSVGVLEMKETDAPYIVTVAGRAVAYEEVEIRPRVAGEVSEIAYQPGRKVDVGALLFKIDDDTYSAQLESAKADVASAKAALTLAASTLKRYQQIEDTGVTGAEVETAAAEVAKAQAALQVAEAAQRVAELSLKRTEIRSPIAGTPSIASVAVGDIVTASQTEPLATITRLDPIYVDVEESSARILRNRELIAKGVVKRSETIEMRLTLENGSEYEFVGSVVSPGHTVSTGTGTTEFRLQFDNPDRLIMPGQFLRVDAQLGSIRAFLVPQGATRRDAGGQLIAFVVKNGTATRVTLSSVGSYRNAWIVTSGLEEGDRLIADNLRSVQDGAKVATVPVELDENGVIRDIAPASSDGEQAAAKEQ